MKSEERITEELQSMGSILAGMPRTMPYVVPADHFVHFSDSVKDIINDLEVDDVTPVWGKVLPYTVPGNYFEELPGSLAIHTASSKAAPFNVPERYFDTLPAQVLLAAKDTERRTIPLKRRTLSNPIKWLAAAVLVLGLGFGSYRIFFSMEQASGSEKMLSAVPSNDIQEYLQHIYRVDIDKIVTNNSMSNMNIDNKDIIQYLNETGWD